MPKKLKLKVGDYVRLRPDGVCQCTTCAKLRSNHAMLLVVNLPPENPQSVYLRTLDGEDEDHWNTLELVKDVFLSAAAQAVKRKPSRAAAKRAAQGVSPLPEAAADSK